MKQNAKGTNGQQAQGRKPNEKGKATRLAILAVVDRLVDEVGMSGVNLKRVSAESGISCRLLHYHFQNLDGLKMAYLASNDFWLSLEPKIEKFLQLHRENSFRELSSMIVKSYFMRIYADPELRQILVLQLTSGNAQVTALILAREALGEKLFAITDAYFKGTTVDFRWVAAVLIGSMSFIVVHGFAAGTTFCGKDVHDSHEQLMIRKTIEQIVVWAYDQAERDKRGKL